MSTCLLYFKSSLHVTKYVTSVTTDFHVATYRSFLDRSRYNINPEFRTCSVKESGWQRTCGLAAYKQYIYRKCFYFSRSLYKFSPICLLISKRSGERWFYYSRCCFHMHICTSPSASIELLKSLEPAAFFYYLPTGLTWNLVPVSFNFSVLPK